VFANQAENALTKAIMEASKFYLPQYIEGVKKLEEQNLQVSEFSEKLVAVRRDYLDLVSNSIINNFEKQRPDIAKRIQAALVHPEICGYKGIDLNHGISAGALFAICLYAIENRVARSADCIMLNRSQNDLLMNELH